MATTPARVVVFLDYQNVYMGARSCFHSRVSPHFEGQINPLRLGEHLAADSPYDRELKEVRVYRGLPDGALDPRGHSAASRQIDIWRQNDKVQVFPRPLSYPSGWPDRSRPGEKPREKGIDVTLAIHFAMLAVQDYYDVGILMSTDTDLKPALEAVIDIAGGRQFPRAEVAAWSGENMRNRRLALTGESVWCHWLDKVAYDQVSDHTDYSDSAWP